jgi:hypothetical protein
MYGLCTSSAVEAVVVSWNCFSANTYFFPVNYWHNKGTRTVDYRLVGGKLPRLVSAHQQAERQRETRHCLEAVKMYSGREGKL